MTPLCRNQNSLFLSITSKQAPFWEGAPHPPKQRTFHLVMCLAECRSVSPLAVVCPSLPSATLWPAAPDSLPLDLEKRGELTPLRAALLCPSPARRAPSQRRGREGKGCGDAPLCDRLDGLLGRLPLLLEGTGHVFLIVERLLWAGLPNRFQI